MSRRLWLLQQPKRCRLGSIAEIRFLRCSRHQQGKGCHQHQSCPAIPRSPHVHSRNQQCSFLSALPRQCWHNTGLVSMGSFQNCLQGKSNRYRNALLELDRLELHFRRRQCSSNPPHTDRLAPKDRRRHSKALEGSRSMHLRLRGISFCCRYL